MSVEQLENILHTSGNYDIPYHKDSIMSYGNICEHDDGYLCEHRRKYIIDLFEKREIPYEDIRRGIKREYLYSNYNEKILMIEGAMWYKERLKKII